MKYIENRKFLRISVGNVGFLLDYPWREPCVSIAGAEMGTKQETTVQVPSAVHVMPVCC